MFRQINFGELKKEVKKNIFIYILLLPSIALVLFFSYFPIPGIKMAFQDYNIFNPSASTFVGLQHFKTIFSNPNIYGAIVNTLKVSFLDVLICFPASIIFALLLNEVRNSMFKKVVQTASYLPHFLSWISVIGIVTVLYSKTGPINDIIVAITGNETRTLFLAEQDFFLPNTIILTLWKGLGWNSIVFLAAITGVDSTLYEAAALDGAGKFKQVLHVTIPTIVPTIIIMLIWKVGSVFTSSFDLIYGLQNPYINFEVIQTLVYKEGIAGGNYPLSTAVGLFQGVANMAMLLLVNFFAKKTTGYGVL